LDQNNFLKIEIRDASGEPFIWIAQNMISTIAHDRGPGLQLSEAQAHELYEHLRQMLGYDELTEAALAGEP
jgi:hypothetical protein